MDDETMLIIGGVAVAGIGLFALNKTLKPVGEGAGDVLEATGDLLSLPVKGFETLANVYESGANSIENITARKRADADTRRIIAEGERTATTIDIGQSAVLQATEKAVYTQNQKDIGFAQASIQVDKLRNTGILPSNKINLGSVPQSKQQVTISDVSLYSKIDKKLGGILPFGVKPSISNLFKKK